MVADLRRADLKSTAETWTICWCSLPHSLAGSLLIAFTLLAFVKFCCVYHTLGGAVGGRKVAESIGPDRDLAFLLEERYILRCNNWKWYKKIYIHIA